MHIGLDIGTSSVKAVLVDDTQQVLATADAPLTVSRPHDGWSEQTPADWWAGVLAAVDALAAAHPQWVAAVRGIGLSGQMHGATLLDADDAVLRPAILWNDTRSGHECAVLEARSPAFRERGGNAVMPGFTAPKLEWVRTHEPEIFARIAKVLLPKDYVRLQLTGDYASDMSDAAGTLWMDVAERRWSPELLAATGLTESQMPRLVEGTEATGTVRAELAARWGMTQAPVVAGGAGDNAATACGLGITAPGSAFVSLGTSGVVFAVTDRMRANPARGVHAFCHAVPGTWHQMGVILCAADALSWLGEITATSPQMLVADLKGAAEGPSSITFLPYLSGERTPHNDPAIRGGFVGLARRHTRADLARAVVEGVAFALKDCVDALEAAGTAIPRLVAAGGGARNAAWLEIIATVCGVPVECPRDSDRGGAFGAARLAMVATGALSLSDLAQPLVADLVVEPVAGMQAAYAQALAKYRGLYPVLKGQ
jgi:xylulokinase